MEQFFLAFPMVKKASLIFLHQSLLLYNNFDMFFAIANQIVSIC